MPTIAEIIAAKKAATAAPIAATAAPIETIAERIATKEAIDRIDPPGKLAVATQARKSASLILNRNMPPSHPNGEPRGQATPISGPPEEPEPRSLSETELEAIPMVPLDADEKLATWHAALNAFESELCLMTDPKDPERAWIAVRLDGQEHLPILLKSLPLYEHPRTQRPENAPF